MSDPPADSCDFAVHLVRTSRSAHAIFFAAVVASSSSTPSPSSPHPRPLLQLLRRSQAPAVAAHAPACCCRHRRARAQATGCDGAGAAKRCGAHSPLVAASRVTRTATATATLSARCASARWSRGRRCGGCRRASTLLYCRKFLQNFWGPNLADPISSTSPPKSNGTVM
uniref:Uncharacterized protein n=1 Tax=Oryza nivara TaxID=4536 RepID=A0A0E0G4A6_ORYNI